MKGPGAGVALGWAAVGAIAVLGLQACWPAARVESPAGIGYVEAWGAEGATIHLVGSVSQHGTPARAPRSQQQLLLQEAPDSPDGGDGPLTVRLRRRMRPSDTKGTRGGGANAYTSPSEGGTDELGEYSAFVGVFSVGKVSGIVRRNTVRRTWFPASEAALAAYESKHNVKMRFVIGKDPILGAVPKEIVREEALHGAFVHINVNEVYDNLKLKMMRYFTTVPKLFNARYYLKVDDDTYFRPDRIALVVPQWEKRSADYIGCSMRGGDMMDKPDRRYYDPQRHLIHGSRFAALPFPPRPEAPMGLPSGGILSGEMQWQVLPVPCRAGVCDVPPRGAPAGECAGRGPALLGRGRRLLRRLDARVQCDAPRGPQAVQPQLQRDQCPRALGQLQRPLRAVQSHAAGAQGDVRHGACDTARHAGAAVEAVGVLQLNQREVPPDTRRLARPL
mmetsp:Transcript_38892/g.97693  ORF Transcript_38892/g.97693 Transcript_38892/m.97693 type:complete len:447 (+) Transcript_38892:135-1475(+)